MCSSVCVCSACGWCFGPGSVTRVQRDIYRQRHHVLASAVVTRGQTTSANIFKADTERSEAKGQSQNALARTETLQKTEMNPETLRHQGTRIPEQ